MKKGIWIGSMSGVAMTGGGVKKGVAKRRGYEGLNVG